MRALMPCPRANATGCASVQCVDCLDRIMWHRPVTGGRPSQAPPCSALSELENLDCPRMVQYILIRTNSVG